MRQESGRCFCESRREAFTLIELLVVVAIIALLISILFPTLSRVRQHARAVRCLAHLRELGRGMLLYHSEWGNYPPHQWRRPDGSRLRWFDAMADQLGERPQHTGQADVRLCPSTPGWVIGRNNSYGYNYKYIGSVRDNLHSANPWRPYEAFPVKELWAPAETIAFADCDGTGWDLEWAPEKPLGDNHPDRLGNHGYLLDPTYIPIWANQTYSGGALEPYAWHNYRSYLSDRHLGGSNAIFADGHGRPVEPREAYRDNSMWNGLGFDPGCDPSAPDYDLDPHVCEKYDPSSGQKWRY